MHEGKCGGNHSNTVGTMAGVRGFGDPNLVISADTNKTSLHSPVSSTVSPAPPPGVNYLLPWHFNHQGGNSNDRYQCAVAGSNGWKQNHAAWDNGNLNKWASKNTPYSLGYYRREDTPLHWELAEGWTVGDAYHESAITSTTPNRISWVGGSIGIDQSKQNLGGPAVDNHETPGCETASDGSKMSCYPYKWKTVVEYLEEAGISWTVVQDRDNFDDNPFAWFENFQKASKDSPLAKATAFPGLNSFYAAARNGTLPQVTFIIGPTQLSEHPPYGPLDGAWLQQQVVNSIVEGKGYDKTALIVSYDETGGWADHVLSPLPDKSVQNEWMTDPYDKSLGLQPVGPGFRVPFYVISPYTRSGGVFSEVSAHESQILFLEKWAAAKGKPFKMGEVSPWRREQLSDLTRMFDFSNKDMSIPAMQTVRQATQDPISGAYNGATTCKLKYGGGQPSVPYTQKDEQAWTLETGYKKVRGNPNIGHYYVFVTGKQALTYNSNAKMAQLHQASKDYSDASQRFVVFAVDKTPTNTRFNIQPAGSGVFLTGDGKVTSDQSQAAVFTITDKGNGKGHAVSCTSSRKRQNGGNKDQCHLTQKIGNVQLFSVTY